jgi:hypothetical protein
MIKVIKYGVPICFNPKGKSVKMWADTFNGTFSNGYPISIMINNGHIIRDNSCHHDWGYPESVLWIKKDGTHGVSRVQTYTQIEGYRDIIFAIGGLGISNLKPSEEGFCKFTRTNVYSKQIETKNFSDVTRRTNHSVFGFKGDLFFASVMYGTSEEIEGECLKQGFTDVIQGDGGSWASCNTDEFDLNLDKVQYSLVQMTNIVELEVVDKPVETVDNVFRLSDLPNPHTPILPGLHFYFDEYLQNNLKLKGYEDDFNIIETPSIMYEIIFHALMMEEYRNRIMRSVNVESGHRPELYNDVVLPAHKYTSSKTSDHKFDKSAALDTNVPATPKHIEIWKEVCRDNDVSWSIGKYSWGLHLGYRRDKNNRMWG